MNLEMKLTEGQFSQIGKAMDQVNSLFQKMAGQKIIKDLPANIFTESNSNRNIVLQSDLFRFFREGLDDLRINFRTLFDMPHPETLQRLKNDCVVTDSRRKIFQRMISQPFPEDPNAPVIISRWNVENHMESIVQIGVALPLEVGLKYLARIIVVDSFRPAEIVSLKDDIKIPRDQEAVYWQLVLQAARMSLAEGRLPFAAVAEHNGKFNPISIARNRNRQQGDDANGHAEHMAMVVGTTYFGKTLESYRPRLFSFAAPCKSCSLMIREQGGWRNGPSSVFYILEQPSGWSGLDVLFDGDLDEDCGDSPAVAQVPGLRAEALAILKDANDTWGRFPGQFNKMIAINEGHKSPDYL